MGDRDDRYNASAAGKAREARREVKKKRRRYKARWMRAYRTRKAGGA